MNSRFRPWWIAALTGIAAITFVLLALNFSVGENKFRQPLARLYASTEPQFQRAMGSLLTPGIVEGNKVSELLNGEQIFPSMLEAIRSARKTITFETYIYWSGDIGKQFADALAERSGAGVKVHILIDWVGSARMDDSLLDSMKRAGIDIRKFRRPAWYDFAKLNNRTHRKLLVVDGAVGFTGGVGVAEKWTGAGQDTEHWRDSHFRIEGPVVAQLQSTFLENWLKVSGQVLHGEPYFPEMQAAGSSRAQMFSSSPTSGSENMELMYHMAITAASRTIDLSMAYFVPDELSSQVLLDAMRRGVKFRLVTPGLIIDTETVRAASRATWGRFLEAGAEIYEFQPSMYHCKVMIVDGLMVSVGSTNFDSRSFKLNDEANLNVYDGDFAARQTRVFEDDIKASRRVSLAQWEARPLSEKVKEQIASLLSPQL